jgi:hypothetical protein
VIVFSDFLADDEMRRDLAALLERSTSLHALQVGHASDTAVAVAGEFVAGGDDAADEGGMALGDPAEGEEGGGDAGLGELFEDAVGVGFHPAGEAVPGIARDGAGEGLDLEVVLHVDGHGIDDRGHDRPPRCGL